MTPQDVVTAQAYRSVIEDRIHELWQYRHWYRVHHGWIPDSYDEDRAELRNLVRLARKARDLSRQPSTPTVRYLQSFVTDGDSPESELRALHGDR